MPIPELLTNNVLINFGTILRRSGQVFRSLNSSIVF